jgi:hypothetical protein
MPAFAHGLTGRIAIREGVGDILGSRSTIFFIMADLSFFTTEYTT